MNTAIQMLSIVGPGVLIVFIIQYFKYKKSTSAHLSKLEQELAKNSTAELEKDLALLKERVIVLERIVTDQSYELDRKINSL